MGGGGGEEEEVVVPSIEDVVLFGQNEAGFYDPRRVRRRYRFFYSDAATSCIICFALVQHKQESPPHSNVNECSTFLFFSHLDTQRGTEEFFSRLDHFLCDLQKTLSREQQQQQQRLYQPKAKTRDEMWRVDIYACGALDVEPKDKKNEGQEKYECFISKINELQRKHDRSLQKTEECSNNEEDGEDERRESMVVFDVSFNTPDLLFKPPGQNTTRLMLDLDSARAHPIKYKGEINVEVEWEKYAAHYFALLSDSLVWLDETQMTASVRSVLSFLTINHLHYFASKLDQPEEELRKTSTTPEHEPPEYFLYQRIQALFCSSLLRRLNLLQQ